METCDLPNNTRAIYGKVSNKIIILYVCQFLSPAYNLILSTETNCTEYTQHLSSQNRNLSLA